MNGTKLKVGSLFSGIGGIELGLERTGGFKTEWFVERDPYAQAVLKKHWPSTPIYDDVETVDFRNVPRVDIITGGFPCQDISNAGKRAGITGSRSSLWRHCVRALRVCRPRFGVFENVAALTRRGLDTVLYDLAEIRYDAEWYVFPAKAVGALHQRERIVIICYPNDNGQSSAEEQGSTDERSDCGETGKESACEFEGSGEQYAQLADTECQRQQEQRESRGSLCQEKNSKGQTSQFKYEGIWSSEPDVGRVADGVPNRMDRIKCLGNAVVPQWAEAVARTIKEALKNAR